MREEAFSSTQPLRRLCRISQITTQTIVVSGRQATSWVHLEFIMCIWIWVHHILGVSPGFTCRYASSWVHPRPLYLDLTHQYPYIYRKPRDVAKMSPDNHTLKLYSRYCGASSTTTYLPQDALSLLLSFVPAPDRLSIVSFLLLKFGE